MRRDMLYLMLSSLKLSSGCVSRKRGRLRGAEQELMKRSALPVSTLMSDIITRDLIALFLSVH